MSHEVVKAFPEAQWWRPLTLVSLGILMYVCLLRTSPRNNPTRYSFLVPVHASSNLAFAIVGTEYQCYLGPALRGPQTPVTVINVLSWALALQLTSD